MLKPPEVSGLEIQVGETQTILRGSQAYYGASLFKFSNGEITTAGMRSHDAGRTWRKAGAGFGTGAFQFPDGEIIQPGPPIDSAGIAGSKAMSTKEDGVYKVLFRRSDDNGMTSKEEPATVYLPEGVKTGMDDQGKVYESTGLLDHAIVSLNDGTLLATMYGLFKNDTVVDPMTAYYRKGNPEAPPEIVCYKNRSVILRSGDRGRTWHYLSTVAFDLSKSDRLTLDGFVEPDLLRLNDGTFLCFMRTGGAAGKYRPLYLSRSNDQGKSWSHAEPIADRGVWPNACLMANGVIAVTYGRPDNWIMFSLDQGQTWKGNFCFWRYSDGATSDYITVEEVEPDTLLVAYDRQVPDEKGKLDWEVAGMRLIVKRK